MGSRDSDSKHPGTSTGEAARAPSRETPGGQGKDGGARASGGANLLPSIELPRGGGALRGIGEKFSTNPANGTGSLSVPIATSPGRGGFELGLALTYDSGAGNGPFGIGWGLSTLSFTRKTDKGLPRYGDAEESDVFVLSGAEDLVPVLVPDGAATRLDAFDRGDHRVQRYRPRTEGLFARIERWTSRATGDTHWRVVTRDNVLAVYGRSEQARIADPERPERVFSWLLEETRDDRGSIVRYTYKPEDGAGVDPGKASEANRFERRPDGSAAFRATAQRYLKRVQYGNRAPVLDREAPAPGDEADWLFEVVLDYGEHDIEAPSPAEGRPWDVRRDPFSSHRATFEVRTYRLCRRVLMFHRFAELGPTPYLVRSTDFTYSEGAAVTYLVAVTQAGYKRSPGGTEYRRAALPPLELGYALPEIHHDVRTIDRASLEGIESGALGAGAQWVDLDGEGIPGVLIPTERAWFYKANLGEGRLAPPALERRLPAPAELGGAQQLTDLDGDGNLDLVQYTTPLAGYFQRTPEGEWRPFAPFPSLPNIDYNDPNLRSFDVDGDGFPDIFITEHDAFVWYRSRGKEGFEPALFVTKPGDERRGPAVVFADGTETIHLADMTGDGLTDIVRVRDGEVCYWPNLGHGRFGRRVTLDGSPRFDTPDRFDPRRVRFADIDGSGTSDIVYLGRDGVRLYFNASGNELSEPTVLRSLPPIDAASSLSVTDLLGQGTACLVWSSSLPGSRGRSLAYVDLLGGKKPHILERIVNNLGAETRITYAPSTKFYLKDKAAGQPWITRLAFPVHVVERVERHDHVARSRFVTTYAYHHGYFDGYEREFRGFGRVEQWDVESFGAFAAANADSASVTGERELYQPPIKTVTWHHTGALVARERALSQLDHEYFPRSFEASRPGALGGFRENALPEPDLAAGDLDPVELREALRACRGMMLRQEIYEIDAGALERGEDRPVKLFSAAYHNCHVRMLQPRRDGRHAVFLVTESEAITYHYELDLRSEPLRPDPRVAHTLNLTIDEQGNVLQSVAVGYPRFGRHADPSLPEGAEDLIARVQGETHLVYTEARYTGDVDEPGDHRLRVPCEVKTYELTGVTPAGAASTPDARGPRYFTLDQLRRLRLGDEHPATGTPVPEIPYHHRPHGASPQKRLVEHARTLFFGEDLAHPLPLGQLHRLGLTYETYKLALTRELLGAVFSGGQLTGEILADLDDPQRSGYASGPRLTALFPGAAGQYWARSGVAGFEPDAARRFYLPSRYTDAFGSTARLTFDPHDLFPTSSTDALGNTVTARYNYRVLSPCWIQDINDNVSEVLFDVLGMPVATALEGKGSEGDHLRGLHDEQIDLSPDRTSRLFTGRYDEAEIRELLGTATARHVYHFGEVVHPDGRVTYGGGPAAACTIVRETHVAALGEGQQSRVQVSFEYSDGGGNVLVKKAQAEPAHGETALRWLASGKTVLNNKGNPVKQYEPYFSEGGHGFEEPVEVGVSSVIYYDAPGRAIRTEHPDGSYVRAETSPWHVTTFDTNDTALEPGNAWYAARTGPDVSAEDRAAARQAASHAGTPAVVFLDSLGREVVQVAHNRYADRRGVVHDEKHVTFSRLDAEGKPLYIRDARGNLVMQYIRPALPDDHRGDPGEGFVPCYDIAGHLLFQHSMDAGDRWMLSDAAGQPLFAWDINDRLTDSGERVLERRVFSSRYDALRRPVEGRLRIGEGPWQVVSRMVYGDALPSGRDARAENLRGQVYEHFDPSGLVRNVRYDFKGGLLEVERRLVRDVEAPVIDWSAAAPDELLEAETFRKRTEYDALGRMTRLVNWHRSAARVTVYEPRYNERGLLAGEDLVTGGGARVPAATGIRYNAKGQRERIQYGNGTITRHDFDPLTFRLRQIRTTRPGYDPRFPGHRSGLVDERVVQQLHYTYDAAGNITEVHDEAYEPVFFGQQRVEARSRYTYDALYRLIAATGRESAQLSGAPAQTEGEPDVVRSPEAPGALRNYVEHYTYDAVGNIQEIAHRVGPGARPGAEWTRHYEYQATSNRLSRTWLGDAEIDATRYEYDLHGSMASFANVDPEYHLRWDYRDMVRAVNRGGGGWVHYNYDAEKQRTRKVIRRRDGTRQWERIYLGGAEVYRSYAPDGRIEEEIETHHLFVEGERVLIVDDVIATNDDALGRGVLYRYQYGNHLGSVGLELDAGAAILSYEEYHPYGTSAYRARGRDVRATKKRYRYTGMERDEETGLSYHTARYYAPWLGRWASADPKWLIDGLNLYQYAQNDPARRNDSGGAQARPTRPDGVENGHGGDTGPSSDQQEPRRPSALDLLESVRTDFESRDGQTAALGLDLTLIDNVAEFFQQTLDLGRRLRASGLDELTIDGIIAHRLIGAWMIFEFPEGAGVRADSGMRQAERVLDDVGLFPRELLDANYRIRPDVWRVATGEVWEIKSERRGDAAAREQAQVYVDMLRSMGERQARLGTSLRPGTHSIPVGQERLDFWQSGPGAILYRWSMDNDPLPVPAVAEEPNPQEETNAGGDPTDSFFEGILTDDLLTNILIGAAVLTVIVAIDILCPPAAARHFAGIP